MFEVTVIDLTKNPKLLRFHVDGTLQVLIRNGKLIVLKPQLGNISGECSYPQKYQHDCTECIYLGREIDPKTKLVFDGYYHFNDAGESIVARFGDAGPSYISSPIVNGELLVPDHDTLIEFYSRVNLEFFKKAIELTNEQKN